MSDINLINYPFPHIFATLLSRLHYVTETYANIMQLVILFSPVKSQEKAKGMLDCGEIITSEGKERKINIDFEPFSKSSSLVYYHCPLADMILSYRTDKHLVVSL